MHSLARIFFMLILCGTLSACGRYFYYPDRAFYYPPDKNGFTPDDVWFKSGDGNDLHGWFFHATNKPVKGTIVQFHGNAQNISSHYASLVWLTGQGYNLFTFDYRGYGDSPGEPNAEGTYKDGMAALDKAWHLHRKSKSSRFIVYGQSLGGAVALRALADFKHRDAVDLVVADSTFASYEDMVQEKMANIWIIWPFSWLGPFLVSDRFAPERLISRLKSRLLVVHDLRDSVVEFRNGKKIFDLATAKKDFWMLDQARHVGLFALDNPEYRVRFLKLLDELRL